MTPGNVIKVALDAEAKLCIYEGRMFHGPHRKILKSIILLTSTQCRSGTTGGH